MPYTSPGVQVTNSFQPIVSSTVGGDRVLAIVGKVLVTNYNLYPQATTAARKGVTGVAYDSVVIPVPDPYLGTIADTQRVVNVWQGGTQYFEATSNYAVTQTRGASGVSDGVTSTLTTPVSGAQVLAVYQKTATIPASGANPEVLGTFTAYTAGTDFTAALSFTGTLKATITWTGANQPGTGTSYTVVFADSGYSYYPAVDQSVAGQVTINFYWSTFSSSLPTNGSSYNVQALIEYPYERTVVTALDDVLNTFGPIIDPTDPDFTDSTRINQLSLAAYIAFAEGAPSLVLVPYDQINLTYADALGYLATDDTVNIVAGVDPTNLTPGGTSLNDLIRQHVETCSTNTAKKYRMGLYNPMVGNFNAAFDQSAPTGYKSMLGVCNSQRQVIIGASQLDFSIPIANGTYVSFKSNGGYGNVVYGAMMCRPSYDVATAMLRKPSQTITKIESAQNWDDTKLDMLAAMGVTLFALIDGVYTVRDDITTSQLGLEMQMEPAITMLSDNITKGAIKVLNASVIGGKLLIPTTLQAIQTTLMSFLDSKTSNPSIINGYSTPVVVVTPNVPNSISVTISVVPIQKVRNINIAFSYVTSLS